MRPFRLSTSYLGTTIAYGAVRKFWLTRDAKVEYYDNKKQDMFVSSRVTLVAMGGASAIFLWPLYVGWDVQRLFIASRGESVREYGYREPKYTIEYLWM